jgi:hypothetical protein
MTASMQEKLFSADVSYFTLINSQEIKEYKFIVYIFDPKQNADILHLQQFYLVSLFCLLEFF